MLPVRQHLSGVILVIEGHLPPHTLCGQHAPSQLRLEKPADDLKVDGLSQLWQQEFFGDEPLPLLREQSIKGPGIRCHSAQLIKGQALHHKMQGGTLFCAGNFPGVGYQKGRQRHAFRDFRYSQGLGLDSQPFDLGDGHFAGQLLLSLEGIAVAQAAADLLPQSLRGRLCLLDQFLDRIL